MTPTYLININYTDKCFRKLSLIFFCIAFFGFWTFYFIEPFIQIITGKLFHKWLLYVLNYLLLIGIFSFIFNDIRKNTCGVFKIYENAIEIKSKSNSFKIYFKELKRISFVVATFTFKPYRIEFIYPNFQLTRIKIRTKEDFYEIMNHLYEVTPECLEKHVNAFESVEK